MLSVRNLSVVQKKFSLNYIKNQVYVITDQKFNDYIEALVEYDRILAELA